MIFCGRLRTHSPVWRLWREHARVSGQICGVMFTWEQGNVYRTEPLTEDEVGALYGHDSVVLEVVSHHLPIATDAPAVVAHAERPVAVPAPKAPAVSSRRR